MEDELQECPSQLPQFRISDAWARLGGRRVWRACDLRVTVKIVETRRLARARFFLTTSARLVDYASNVIRTSALKIVRAPLQDNLKVVSFNAKPTN